MKISNDHLNEILERARSAPTPDNVQQWRFHLHGETLFVEHQESLANHPLNPANLTSVLTLGCMLEAIKIAATHFGLVTEVQLDRFPAGENEVWAKINFVGGEAPLDELFSALEHRTTDRRLFRKGFEKLPVQKLKLLSDSRAEIHLAPVSRDLVDYIVNTEDFLPKHPGALPAVLKWVRFSLSSARRTGDGLSWHNMGVKFWELPVIKLIQSFPGIVTILRPGLLPPHRARTRAQVASSAAVIAVSIPYRAGAVPSIAPIDIVQAGRTMFRAWLELTKAGFAVQPLSLSSLPIYYDRSNQLDDFFTSQKALIRNGEKLLRDELGISLDRLPVWMFRTGLGEPLPEHLRTFRRPFDLRQS